MYSNHLITKFFQPTVISFVEMARFLLKLPGVKFLLSKRFCQDHLESFFGHQRLKEDAMTIQLLNNSVTTLFHFECRDQPLLTPYVETAESDRQIKLYLWMIHPYQNVAGNHTSRTHTIYTNHYNVPINVMPYCPPPPHLPSLPLSAKGEAYMTTRSLRIWVY